MADDSDNFNLYGEDEGYQAGNEQLYSNPDENGNNDMGGGTSYSNNGGLNNDEELVDFEVDAISPFDQTQSGDGRLRRGSVDPSDGSNQGGSRGLSQSHALPPTPVTTGPKALYVNELTWWTTDEELRLIVADAGVGDQLGVKDLVFQEHKINGKSRGLVYMEFSTPQAARTIKDLMDKMEIHGKRPVAVLIEPVERTQLFKFLPRQINNQGAAMNERPSGNMGNPGMGGGMGHQGGQGGVGPMRNNFQQRGNRNMPYSRPNQGMGYMGRGGGMGGGNMMGGNMMMGGGRMMGGGGMGGGGMPYGRQMGGGMGNIAGNMGGNMGGGGMGMMGGMGNMGGNMGGPPMGMQQPGEFFPDQMGGGGAYDNAFGDQRRMQGGGRGRQWGGAGVGGGGPGGGFR
ncbi:hypothetical protein HDU97_005521 [Phlyctochytrium planicorne]|nr:hypothetical protein HDU97_005521 [Phlyctochytrium planicorne]